jgi:uncharacterized protein with GYD domain
MDVPRGSAEGPQVGHRPRGSPTVTKYLIRASYTHDGLQGLLREGGTERRVAIEKLTADIGGHLEAFYFAFGDDDVVAIVEAPDDVKMAAVSLMINAAGAATCKVTPLLTPEDVDAATKVTVNYRAPGA